MTQATPNDSVNEQSPEEQKPEDTSELEQLRAEINEFKAGWQRAVADYQNLQRETARQRMEWASMSEWQIISEFIPVYDNLKKAFASNQQSVAASGRDPAQGGTISNQQSWVKGIEFIMKQFGEILKAHGVEEIKTVGEMFDPVKHEIVGEEAADQLAHTIVKEMEGGYMVKGKVVKVAKVVVAKTKNLSL